MLSCVLSFFLVIMITIATHTTTSQLSTGNWTRKLVVGLLVQKSLKRFIYHHYTCRTTHACIRLALAKCRQAGQTHFDKTLTKWPLHEKYVIFLCTHPMQVNTDHQVENHHWFNLNTNFILVHHYHSKLYKKCHVVVTHHHTCTYIASHHHPPGLASWVDTTTTARELGNSSEKQREKTRSWPSLAWAKKASQKFPILLLSGSCGGLVVNSPVIQSPVYFLIVSKHDAQLWW